MSNILIIKHGSLGDIVQISGVLRDIRESNNDKKIFILTTLPYVDLLSRCPYINGVLIDKRRPRWNILYLYKLKKMVEKFNFTMVFDLQNSTRTSFYKKYLFKIPFWNSAVTSLKKGERKKDFDNYPVLERFKLQLDSVKVKTNYTLQPDFSWAVVNIDQIVNKYFGKKFILIFPFSSPNLSHKQWPHYNNLINIIKSKHNTEIVIAPSNNEVQQGKNINAISILNNGKALNIMQVAGLIKKSTFVISNDTGPAHMSAHLGAEGVTLFGYHTTPEKVSIETDKFKAIKSVNLEKLSAEDVYKEIKPKLELLFNKA
tara:strand:+ start:1233 stop:2177 length:945 start_codon:yes stop_codon:yes gene_type:complete